MIYTVEEAKASKLKFGDIITGTFMRGEYTHDTSEIKPASDTHYVPINKRDSNFDYDKPQPYEVYHKMFLMSRLIDGKWIVDPRYCVGFKSLKDTINSYDLKQFKKQADGITN